MLKRNTTSTGQLRLYVSVACPFSHRVLAALALTGLQGRVKITRMNIIKRKPGWTIASNPDPVFGRNTLREVYDAIAPGVDQRASVPLLIEENKPKLISSDSLEITRLISRGFDGKFQPRINLAPRDLIGEIDQLSKWLHKHICRAVYNVGFATEQNDYDRKVCKLFDSLDAIEAHLAGRRYLIGSSLSEADLVLFATLVRFDVVYAPLFKCSIRNISDYPVLSAYLQHLMAIPALAKTVDLPATVTHYYASVIHTEHGTLLLNPSGVIPAMPQKYLIPKVAKRA